MESNLLKAVCGFISFVRELGFKKKKKGRNKGSLNIFNT